MTRYVLTKTPLYPDGTQGETETVSSTMRHLGLTMNAWAGQLSAGIFDADDQRADALDLTLTIEKEDSP